MIDGADCRALWKICRRFSSRLADPLALELRAARRSVIAAPIAVGHRLGEERLAGAGRAPEDHAARDQLLDAARSPPRRSAWSLRGEHVEDLAAQPLLHLGVAADVACRGRRSAPRARRRASPAAAGGRRASGRRGSPRLRACESSRRRRTALTPETYLYSCHGLNVAAELAALALRDEVPQPVRGDAEQADAVREQVLDHLRQRERRVLEPEPDELGVLVEQRDDLARLGRSARPGWW